MRRRRADNTEVREPLFGWRTMAVVLSLYAMWIGASALNMPRPNWRWGTILIVLAALWTTAVLGWVAYRSLAYRLGEARMAAMARWLRWVRLPPFWVSYTICGGTLLAFVGWVLADAQFPFVLAAVQEPLRGDNLLWDMAADDIPWRMVCFVSLASVAMLSLGVVAARMFVGSTKGGRSLRTWMLAIALIATWLGLWSSYDRIQWLGVQRRVRSALPRFQAAAAPLIEEWPTAPGTLPEAGGFYAYPLRMPNTILLYERRGYAVMETFGHQVSRTTAGALRFDVDGAYDCKIEYHPPASTPYSHVDPFGSRFEVRDIVRLEDYWYLVRYEASPVDDND